MASLVGGLPFRRCSFASKNWLICEINFMSLFGILFCGRLGAAFHPFIILDPASCFKGETAYSTVSPV
jgi:hypothetical protein